MKHVERRARFQYHRDANCHKLFFSARQGAKGNLRHSDRTLGENAPSYATIKNWVAQFKRDDIFTSDAPSPGGPKQ
jgi:hypothetical protein